MEANEENMSSSSGDSSGTTASIETTLPSSSTPQYTTTTNINIDNSPKLASKVADPEGIRNSTTNIMEKAEEKPVGIDNPGFVDEDDRKSVKEMETPKSSKNKNGNYNNGAFLNSPVVDTSMLKEVSLSDPGNEVIKDKAMTEAVNLELVNMNPYKAGEKEGVNGIPIKKTNGEEGVSGNYHDPYDEYFVPVNEHRKYMRGEKLYVTKDKRRTQSWKRCICWSIGFVVLAIAIVIAILAGTGVILSQEDTPVLESSSRQFGSNDLKAAGFGNLPARPPNESSSTTALPPGITELPGLQATDMAGVYVPNVLEGELVIDNMEFSALLADRNSSEYKALAASLQEELKNALFDQSTLNYGSADIFVKVMEFSAGSVVTKFRIGWVFKEGIRNPPNPIDKDLLRERLEKHLARYAGFLHTYHLAKGSTRASNVIDNCKFNNGDCTHECIFDYNSHLNFMCKCPEDMMLDTDGKKCVPKTGAGVLPGEPSAEPEATPEPSAVPESNSSPEPEPSSSPEPEPSSSPEPEPSSSPEPEPSSSPEPEPSSSPEPEPSSSPEPEPSSSPEPEPSSSPEPEPSSSPEPEPSSSPEPEPSPSPEPEPSSSPEPEPSSSSEPEPNAAPEPEPNTEAPSPEPTPTTPDTQASNVEHVHDHVHSEKTNELLVGNKEFFTTIMPEMSNEEMMEHDHHHHLMGGLDMEHTTMQPTKEPTSTQATDGNDGLPPSRIGGKQEDANTEMHMEHQTEAVVTKGPMEADGIHDMMHHVIHTDHDHEDHNHTHHDHMGHEHSHHDHMSHEENDDHVDHNHFPTEGPHMSASDATTKRMDDSVAGGFENSTGQPEHHDGLSPLLVPVVHKDEHETTLMPVDAMHSSTEATVGSKVADESSTSHESREKDPLRRPGDDPRVEITTNTPFISMDGDFWDQFHRDAAHPSENTKSNMTNATTDHVREGGELVEPVLKGAEESSTENVSSRNEFQGNTFEKEEKKQKNKFKYDEPKPVIPLPYGKANKTKDSYWLDDLLASENDTSLNALSPDDYDNSDHFFVATKNETNSKLTLKKRLRLDKDEMHFKNPSEEKNAQTERSFESFPELYPSIEEDRENKTEHAGSHNNEPNNIWEGVEQSTEARPHGSESVDEHGHFAMKENSTVHDHVNNVHETSNSSESSRMFPADDKPHDESTSISSAAGQDSTEMNPMMESSSTEMNPMMESSSTEMNKMVSDEHAHMVGMVDAEMTTASAEGEEMSTSKEMLDLPPVLATLFPRGETMELLPRDSISTEGDLPEDSTMSFLAGMKMMEMTTLPSDTTEHVRDMENTTKSHDGAVGGFGDSESASTNQAESTTASLKDERISKSGARTFNTDHVSPSGDESSTNAMGESSTASSAHQDGGASTNLTEVVHVTSRPDDTASEDLILNPEWMKENKTEAEKEKKAGVIESTDDENRLANDLHAFAAMAESNMSDDAENKTEEAEKKVDGVKVDDSGEKDDSKTRETGIENQVTTESATSESSGLENATDSNSNSSSTESVIYISDADKKDTTTRKTFLHGDNVFGDSVGNDYTEEDIENKLLYSTGLGVDKATSSATEGSSTQASSSSDGNVLTTESSRETTRDEIRQNVDSESTSTEVVYSKEGFNKGQQFDKDISVVPLKQDAKKNNKKLVKLFNDGSQEGEQFDKTKSSKYDKEGSHKMDRFGLAANTDQVDYDSDPFNMFDDYENLDINRDTEGPYKVAATTEQTVETPSPTHFVPTPLPEETSTVIPHNVEKEDGEEAKEGNKVADEPEKKGEMAGSTETPAGHDETVGSNNSAVSVGHDQSSTTMPVNQTEGVHEVVKPLSHGLEPAYHNVATTTAGPIADDGAFNVTNSISSPAEEVKHASPEVVTTTEAASSKSTTRPEETATTIPTFETNATSTTFVNNVTVTESEIIPGANFFSKCAAGQFQCVNGTARDGTYCVSTSTKCDSISDCSDGSDELGCIEQNCPGNFQCASGQCLKRHLVCNGIVDCNDGSDEVECQKWNCHFDEFQCPSGRCIPVLWQCDGKPDCVNHTDEYNCQTSCGNDEFLCPEGWCIPMTWRCNGVNECANGEDEKLCDCSLDEFKCHTGGCVMKPLVCDGIDHCPDASDEWDCLRLRNDSMQLQIRSWNDDWSPVCKDQWDASWSDLACRNLGYSKSVFTEFKPYKNATALRTLKPVTLTDKQVTRLPAALGNDTCEADTYVEVACLDFTCGSHSLAGGVAARLVGGDGATNGQWPSVALLYHTRHKSSCTASIISPKWLLSSYNCLHLRDKELSAHSWVAFGGGSMFDTGKPETQIKEVRSIIPYPQVKYNQFLYNNDIALIELTAPLTFTRYVGAICLPDKEIEPRQLCVTAGWGYTSPGQINFSQYLHYLPVPTIDLKECNSSKHYAGFITDDEICAGFTDAEKSPCYNDEGAPLMCVSEGGVWELQGVLSYHSNCGRGYHPSIFSSITAVRGWVEKTIGGRFERKSTFNVR